MIVLDRSKEFTRLKLVLLRCFSPSTEHVDEYNEVYRVWREVWEVGVKELYGEDSLASDHFVRQDFVAAIFRDDTCLASCCYKKINLSIPAHIDDSWFKPWPRETILELQKNTPIAVQPSWLTVNAKYRRRQDNYPVHLAQLMMEMLNFVTVQLRAQIAFGVSRNDRSVDRLLRHIGGVEPIAKDVSYQGFQVDLFKFTREELSARMLEFSEETHALWNNRLDLRATNTRSMNYEIGL